MSTSQAQTHRESLFLGFAAFLIAAMQAATVYAPNTWINRDGRFYTNVNTTIVENFSLDQSGYAASWYTGQLPWYREMDQAWSNISIGRNGEHLPKHPLLMPIASTPLFFAFGLIGTLLFNLMSIGLAGFGLFRFARAYAGSLPSAAAVVVFLFGTSIRGYAYDYLIDVFNLGLFGCLLACLVENRPRLLGVLLGLMVMIRPSILMFVPSLFLLSLDRKVFVSMLRSLVPFFCVIVVWGVINTWLFGRPWWVGYNRILIVHQGVPGLDNVNDAFSTPLSDGLRRIWQGDYGLRVRFAVLGIAAPGLIYLLFRRPLSALATLTGVAVSLYVFGRYVYEGDRFQWPALALLVPAVAMSFEGVDRAVSKVRPWLAAVGVALTASLTIVVANFLWDRNARAWLDGELAVSDWGGLKHGAHALLVVLLGTGVAHVLRKDRRVFHTGVLFCVTGVTAIAFANQFRLPWPRLTESLSQPERTAAAACLALLAIVGALGFSSLTHPWRGTRWAQATMFALAGLCTVGLVHRVQEHHQQDVSFVFPSHRALLDAQVKLGEVPCDFLAWEHMSWECSRLDRGTMTMVGLALPEGIKVDGQPREMLLLTGDHSGQNKTRVVNWKTPKPGQKLDLDWATPDGLKGGCTVTLQSGGRTLHAFESNPSPGATGHVEIATPSAQAELSLSITGRRCAIAMRGRWEY